LGEPNTPKSLSVSSYEKNSTAATIPLQPSRPLREAYVAVATSCQKLAPVSSSRTPHPGLFTRPRAGHVEDLHMMLLNKSLQLIRGRAISLAKMQPRFVVLAREFSGLQRAAGQSRFNREQNGSVTITHIPFGSLNICSRRRFFQRILRINRPIFCLPTLRPEFHAVRERPIQRSRSAPVCPPDAILMDFIRA
jgi:hypothetical protein